MFVNSVAIRAYTISRDKETLLLSENTQACLHSDKKIFHKKNPEHLLKAES